jgi:hypothetical protein
MTSASYGYTHSEPEKHDPAKYGIVHVHGDIYLFRGHYLRRGKEQRVPKHWRTGKPAYSTHYEGLVDASVPTSDLAIIIKDKETRAKNVPANDLSI